MNSPERFYHRFWFAWLFLTVLYIGLSFGIGFKTLGSPVGVLGLFVPFGLLNSTIMLLGIWETVTGGGSLDADRFRFLIGSITSIGLLLLCLTRVDRWFRASQLTPVYRVLGNIIILGILTLCVDLLLFGDWESLKIVIGTHDWMRVGY